MKQQVLRLHAARGACSKCGADLTDPRRKPCKAQVCKRCRSEAHRLLAQVKSRCKRLGIPFDLTVADVPMPDMCPVFGIPFDKGDRWKRASLDRFVPSLGYVRGNVWVVSCRANTIKGNATADELEHVARAIRSEAARRFRAQSNSWFKAVA